jgi:ferritin-like metal-binding protein YciE
MKVDTIEKMLVEELKDLYFAENQITKALPKMAKSSSSNQLKTAFEHHLEETRGQIERLDRIFTILAKSPKGKTCDGMKGLLQEGSQAIEETSGGPVRDAAMASAAQRVEHYEIAGYGSVRTYAQLLDLQRLLNFSKRLWKKRRKQIRN